MLARRLGWWDTDLISDDGGGDLLSRLLPQAHAWASLEAVREAARRTDAKARSKMADPDKMRTLYFLGFELDEQLGDRLAAHKRSGSKPVEALPLPLPITQDFSKERFVAVLHGGDVPFTMVPNGRQLKGARGGVARDNEHIHSAVLRLVQARLGYCSKSNLVADFELRLERDGEWETFVQTAKKTLGKDWTVAKEEEQADDHFSHVLHGMKPDRYPEPTSWIDSRAGSRTGSGTSVREVVEAIDAMIHIREENKSLFIVVDEVSQYVHEDESRMLKLQSFVSELGQRLKGRVWLFATGQQKLEEQAENNNIGKLKDRFPTNLRVHLGTTNIRDVVHKRLLKKKPELEGTLRELFQKHRGDLKLYGYRCEEITEEDFVEVYPMLPEHIELLMDITSILRTRSSRVQGDDYAIRGLLQLLGELFREQKLAEGEVGQLVTLDAIFEVQHSALDADVQTTLSRIFNDPQVRDDVLAQRVAKAVALLEVIQEKTPTMPALVAACLYSRLGEGNRVQAVTDALEKLRSLSLLSYSEKHGFKIQSSTGQEWQRERDDIGVTQEQISKIVQNSLKHLVGSMQELGLCSAELTAEAIETVGRAARVRDHELSQLRQMEELAGLEDDAAVVTNRLAAERPWREAVALTPAVDRIRARYIEVRRALLNKQNVEAEAARNRVKTRPGFAQLDADQAHRVLRPIAEVLVDTTPEAISPALVEVRDRFASRIHHAEEAANDRLDEELSKKTERQVVKVETHLRGREVANREQLKAVLKELEDRIGPLLDRGARVGSCEGQLCNGAALGTFAARPVPLALPSRGRLHRPHDASGPSRATSAWGALRAAHRAQSAPHLRRTPPLRRRFNPARNKSGTSNLSLPRARMMPNSTR